MPRPTKIRHISCNIETNYFKPRGIPVRELKEVILTEDELEAIRLADFDGLYQQAAADKMNVSRQTFGNIIRSAHNKIADVLLNSKALRIEGGAVVLTERRFQCEMCNHKWTSSIGVGPIIDCPQCRDTNVLRV
jgi:predicted DNA-binding protein (UPF0251 family)